MSDSMNKRELAAAMRVSTTTVDNWLNRGCPFRKAPDGATVGEGYQFDLAEVQHWLDRRDRRGAGRPGSSSGRTWADALRLLTVQGTYNSDAGTNLPLKEEVEFVVRGLAAV